MNKGIIFFILTMLILGILLFSLSTEKRELEQELEYIKEKYQVTKIMLEQKTHDYNELEMPKITASDKNMNYYNLTFDEINIGYQAEKRIFYNVTNLTIVNGRNEFDSDNKHVIVKGDISYLEFEHSPNNAKYMDDKHGI